MHSDDSPIITRLLRNRQTFVEIMLGTIVLALCINLIAGSLIEKHWLSADTILIFAVTLGVACLIYFILRFLSPQQHRYSFSGCVSVNKNSEILPIERYDYMRDLYRYFQAAFSENAALKKIWFSLPINDAFKVRRLEQGVDGASANPPCYQLLTEATEYYFLENLCTHLGDYFNEPSFKKDKLSTFERNDIPDILLSNRFLELFSKSMDDRSAFADDPRDDLAQGQVVMAVSHHDAFFNLFELTLPAKSKVRRISGKAIEIDTERFVMRAEVDFNGYGSSYLYQYIRTLLFKKDVIDLHEYKIDIHLVVNFKFASLLRADGWEYYQWLESFVDWFREQFSVERFLNQIGWETSQTIIEYLSATKSKRE